MPALNAALQSKIISDTGVLFNGGTVTVKNAIGGTIVAFTLQNPAFSETGGTITALGVPITEEATGSGDATTVDIENSTYAVEDLTVGTSNANAIIDNVNITAGQDVTLIALSLVLPAGVDQVA